MTPLAARLHGIVIRIRCRLELHEWLLEPQEARQASGQEPASPAILRLRCLHCPRLTAGWIVTGPRYSIRQEADRAKLVLHNPRLASCPCARCQQTRDTLLLVPRIRRSA